MRFWLPQTIQARLIFSHLLVSIISVILISIYTGNLIVNSAIQQGEELYERIALTAARAVEGVFFEYLAGQATLEQVNARLESRFSGRDTLQYTIYLPDGTPVLDRSGVLPPPASEQTAPDVWDALENPSVEGHYYLPDEQGGGIFHLAARLESKGQMGGILRIGVSMDSALSSARSALFTLAGAALLVALVMSTVGIILARSIAVPIEGITRSAESLASGKLNARVIPPAGPQEIHRLAEAFNNMALRMQSHVAELRGFVANASHELRTPLTSIRLRVEALRSGALDDPPVTERFLAEVEGEVDRLSAMVNDLLDLSRIESGLDPNKLALVDLANVAGDVYESFRVRAERAEIDLSASIAQGLPPVLGNEDQLRRMLYNLVDNAIKYTSRAGKVEISLEQAADSGKLVLKVSDTGYGIAPAHLPHLFDRFYRVEATRPRYGPSHGSGLGLSIAKSISEAHDGKIGVTSQLGEGTTFWVELPPAKSLL